MQVETVTRICPLCRRPADGEDTPASRLCRDCRALLDPILPRAGAVQTDYAVTLPNSPAWQATAAAPSAYDADFDGVAFAPAADLNEDFALVNDRFTGGLGGDLRAHSAASATPYEDQDVFIAPHQYEDDEMSEGVNPETADAVMPPAPAAFVDTASVAETTDAAPAADPRAEALAPALDRRAAQVEFHPGDVDAAGVTAEPSANAASADPWDDPLPAWEYSHNEWPMLAKEQKPLPASRLKWPLAALLIVAVAAAVYFVFVKPRGKAPAPPATLEVSTQPPLTVPVAQPQPADAPPAAGAATTPAPATDKKDAAPAASVTQATNDQSKQTLQAMASPDEAEANGFAARLKGAGLPAYVVRADLGSRGVWYRVRIGGFATPEEAQRFAAEARSRALAIGVTLKALPVTPYEKP